LKIRDARRIALSLPEVTEEPHFDVSSFRVRGKIFATVPSDETLRVFVEEELRDLMVGVDPKAYEKIWWGKKVVGLSVKLAKASQKDLEMLLRRAWARKAPKTLRKAVTLLVVALLAAAAPARAEPPQPLRRIAYASEDSLQFGDLLLPPGPGPFPLAVVIHGGCWLARVGSLDSTAALAAALTDAGIATWNIEYRRVGNRGGGWPGTFLDVGAATDYAKTLARSYPLDLARVVVVGHSAGGHLALWVAARAKLPVASELRRESPLPLRGVVALAGPGDLRTIAAHAGDICGEHTLERLVGGTLELVPEHYAQASPAALLPLAVRQILVAGSEDPVIPTRLLAAYESAARKAGDRVELDEIKGAGHLDLIAPGPPAWATVREKILELVGAATH
jgi:acetyl esterase/lipase